MEFPASIPCLEIEKTHPDYRADLLVKYNDFYQGGDAFERNKVSYMRSRMIEAKNPAYLKQRAQCYHYTPVIAGILDDLCGQALTSPPRIEVLATDDARAHYWLSLNKNIDGEGRDILAQASGRFTQLCVHHRAYLTLINKGTDAQPVNLDQQKKMGGIDVRIGTLDAKDVDDWEYNDHGELEWARSHRVEFVRANGIGPRAFEKHTWCYFTADSFVEYVAQRGINDKGWPDKAEAKRGEVVAHGMGGLPIIPIEVSCDKWPMDQMFSTALALFNREGSREFALDSGALALPVYKGETKPDNVALTEFGCIYVQPNGDFFWRSPDGAVYSALRDSGDDLREALISTLQAMAQRAGNQAQNARQSGSAKLEDKASLKNLLLLLASPIVDAYDRAIARSAKLRSEDDLEPRFCGMEKFDSQNIELDINRTNAFCSIPEQIPEAAHYAKKRLAKDFLCGAPANVITSIENAEIKVMEQPEQEGEFSNIRHAKTGQAAGFGAGDIAQSSTFTK